MLRIYKNYNYFFGGSFGADVCSKVILEKQDQKLLLIGEGEILDGTNFHGLHYSILSEKNQKIASINIFPTDNNKPISKITVEYEGNFYEINPTSVYVNQKLLCTISSIGGDGRHQFYKISPGNPLEFEEKEICLANILCFWHEIKKQHFSADDPPKFKPFDLPLFKGP